MGKKIASKSFNDLINRTLNLAKSYTNYSLTFLMLELTNDNLI